MNILLVDNDINTIETLKAFLGSVKDYKTDTACGGKEALEKLKTVSYDLLLLDIMMPEVSGIDVCRSMIGDENLKKIPVLLISALPIASEDFRKSLEHFNELHVVKGTIEKPVAMDDLLTKVKEVIQV